MNSNILNKFKLIVCIIIGPLVIYFVASFLRNQRLKEVDFTKENFGYTKGIITKKSTHKGNSISLRYLINNKIFEESDGFEEKYNFKEGDSIILKYSKTKPELIITEYNIDY